MSISTLTQKIQFNGDGSAVSFAFNFKVFETSDLVVILTDSAKSQTTWVENTDYTVALTSTAPSAGTVTATTAPASGTTLTIMRKEDLDQQVDFTPSDSFATQTVENRFDKTVMVLQDLQEQIDRCVKFQDSTLGSDGDFIATANKVLSTDSTGKAIQLRNIGTSSIDSNFDSIQNYGNSLATAVSTIGAGNTILVVDVANTVSANLSVPANIVLFYLPGGITTINTGVTLTLVNQPIGTNRQMFSEAGTGVVRIQRCDYVKPEWWGAVADASTDNSAALQSAIDCAQESDLGCKVLVGAGQFNFATALTGAGTKSYTLEGSSVNGTVLKYTGTTGVAITLEIANSIVTNLSLFGSGGPQSSTADTADGVAFNAASGSGPAYTAMQNALVQDFGGSGIVLDGFNDKLSNVKVRNCLQGIKHKGGSGSTILDHCDIRTCAQTVQGQHSTPTASNTYIDTNGRDLVSLGLQVGDTVYNRTEGTTDTIASFATTNATNDTLVMATPGTITFDTNDWVDMVGNSGTDNGYGITFSGSVTNLQMIGCNIELCGTGVFAGATGPSSLLATNCHFEGNFIRDMRLGSGVQVAKIAGGRYSGKNMFYTGGHGVNSIEMLGNTTGTYTLTVDDAEFIDAPAAPPAPVFGDNTEVIKGGNKVHIHMISPTRAINATPDSYLMPQTLGISNITLSGTAQLILKNSLGSEYTIAHSVAGALALDFADGAFQVIELTANITNLSAPSNVTVGALYAIRFEQDGTGRTVAFSSNYKNAPNIPPVASATYMTLWVGVNTTTLDYVGGIHGEIALGSVTLDADASTTVTVAGMNSASAHVAITPINQAAANLINSASAPIITNRAVGSFRIDTADGGNAAGTEQFIYKVTNP